MRRRTGRHAALDLVQIADDLEALTGNRRPVGLERLVQLASRMRPAGNRRDLTGGAARLVEPVEPGIGVGLQKPAERP